MNYDPAREIVDGLLKLGALNVIAHVPEQELLGNYELGFQAMLRLNFPRDRLREIAVTALNTARDVAAAGQLAHLPGNDAR